MSWTQAVCDDRFAAMYPGRDPSRVVVVGADGKPAYDDTCCFCGRPANIYIRIDPDTVPHPRKDD